MDGLPLARAISGSIVRAVFFGLYSASFIHSIRWLLFEDEGWRIRKKVNWILVATTLLIFALSTGLLCGGWLKRFAAPGLLHPIIWSLDVLDCFGIQCSIIIIIDGVLIHRCWTISSKNWLIISFPFVLWCFCLVCSTFSFYCNVYFFVRGLHSLAPLKCFMPYDSVIPLAFYTCNIVINIYTTSVLVYKIWCAIKDTVGTNHLYKICRILTESGILYTLSSLVYLISWIRNYTVVFGWTIQSTLPTQSFLLQPFVGQIASAISTFIPGVAFNLIIIRVGEQRTNEEGTWVNSRGESNIPELSELNNLDTLTRQEVESTDLGQEEYVRAEGKGE